MAHPNERRRKPARDLKWGKMALLACEGWEPGACGDRVGAAVLGGLRMGCTTRRIAQSIGRTDEMVKFYLRRLIARRRALALRVLGGECLRRNCPTAKQIEAVEMMLDGSTQGDVGRRLGVTQAAVASRLKLALRTLSGKPWARDLRAAIVDMSRTNSILAFQDKPGKRPYRGVGWRAPRLRP